MRSALEGTRGITLKGLLVIIALVVVVVLALTPIFRKMASDAISAKCRANLGKIGMAMQQYAINFNEFVPPVQWASPKGKVVPWRDCLKEYLGSDYPAVFACAGKLGANVGYAVNWQTFIWNRATTKKPTCVKLRDIKDPAHTIYALDAGKVTAETKNLPAKAWKETPEDAPNYCRVSKKDKYWTEDPIRPMPRHADHVNCLMLNGSVQSYLVGDIIEPDGGDQACLWDAK
ncbi:MAG: hypothetical protein GXP25_07715 [Planctomycetes bacterium]|nr:hypothetical protein [Planctomycetota bacterium]